MLGPNFTNKTTEFDLGNDVRNYPLDTAQLAIKFSEVWEKYGNTTSNELLLLWEQIFEYINESYYRNVSDINKRYMVVPAATGSGKTQCFRFYAAELAKKEFEENECPGMLIITTYINEINEAVEQINNSVGRDVAAAYHSESSFKIEQDERYLDSYQIVVISHEYFLRNHYLRAVNHDIYQQVVSYKGKQRPIIVVDEAIKLINHIGIDKRAIDSIKYNIGPLYASGNAELKEEYQLISYVHKHFNTLFSDELVKKKVMLVSDKSKLLENLSNELNLPVERISRLFKLNQSIELLKNNNQLYKINKAVTKEGVKGLVDDVVNFQHLLGDSLYLYNDRGSVTYRTSTLELPQQSLVVLDGTAAVDVFYRDFPHTYIYSVPPVKTYEQVEIELIQTKSKLGKSTLRKHPELQEENIIFHLMPRGADIDNTVIFMHKDLRRQLNNDTYKIDNFGNLVGVNTYKDCSNIMIYGIPYKPDFVYYDNLYQSTRDKAVLTEDHRDKILELKYSNIAAEIIQAINRGCCRGIVDGKAVKMNVQLLLPNNKELVKVLVDSIEQEMSEVVIHKTSYPIEFTMAKEKPKPPTTKDIVFIDCIDSNLDEIKLSELYKLAGIQGSKKVVERVLRNLTKPDYSNTYLALKVARLGYKAVKKGQWYLVKY